MSWPFLERGSNSFGLFFCSRRFGNGRLGRNPFLRWMRFSKKEVRMGGRKCTFDLLPWEKMSGEKEVRRLRKILQIINTRVTDC
jgi:hypothetical protein